MPKQINPEMKVLQKSIGFHFYQHKFFADADIVSKGFKPDKFCRDAIDNQIKLLKPEYLKLREEKDESKID